MFDCLAILNYLTIFAAQKCVKVVIKHAAARCKSHNMS